MESSLRYLWVLLACLFLQVHADCQSYGVDFSNGGSYQIDGSSNDYFSFVSVFQGCNQESIDPILVSPDNNEYACSSINTQPDGSQVTSTCGIPYSAMKSGTWRIIVEGQQIAVQRSIDLRIGPAETVVVTATPTIVLGITSTPRAQTVLTTMTQTQTLIIVAQTITAGCNDGSNNGGTRTVTTFPQAQTVTQTSTVVRTLTDGVQTSYWTTTASATAVCHDEQTRTVYDNNPARSAQPSFCVGDDCLPTWDSGEGWSYRGGSGGGRGGGGGGGRGGGGGGRGGGGGGGRGGRGGNKAREEHAADKREIAGSAAVAAITSTYTETTYTVTSTVVTTLRPSTTTEVAFQTTTTTISPPPSTVCTGGNGGQATVTVIQGNGQVVTQTNLVYETTRAAGTVWVGQTQYTTYTNSASATACWRAGGWFGV